MFTKFVSPSPPSGRCKGNVKIRRHTTMPIGCGDVLEVRVQRLRFPVRLHELLVAEHALAEEDLAGVEADPRAVGRLEPDVLVAEFHHAGHAEAPPGAPVHEDDVADVLQGGRRQARAGVQVPILDEGSRGSDGLLAGEGAHRPRVEDAIRGGDLPERSAREEQEERQREDQQDGCAKGARQRAPRQHQGPLPRALRAALRYVLGPHDPLHSLVEGDVVASNPATSVHLCQQRQLRGLCELDGVLRVAHGVQLERGRRPLLLLGQVSRPRPPRRVLRGDREARLPCR
mmetsp:Transcript_57107/g.161227  ORF Transcript_57107/g.161227 Transcript_57107/m.161227 type:complete len:287 (-) Transcript_57107:302-1162(-)